jgi:CHAT domain-containing protein
MAVRRFADAAGAGLGELVREREGLERRWLLNRDAFSNTFSSAGDDADLRKQLQLEANQIQARLDVIDGSLRKNFPDYFALIRPQPIHEAAAQALLAPDEAILLAVPTGIGIHVMAITRERVEWVRSPWDRNQVEAAVQRLRWDAGAQPFVSAEQIEAWQAERQPGAPLSFDRQTAHDLYLQLVAPVATALPGQKRIYVVAGGSLAGLPFSLLVTQPPRGEDDDAVALRGTSWLADAFALVHLPSVQSLALLRNVRARSSQRGGAFIGFGDPVLLGDATSRGRGAATAALPAQGVTLPTRGAWGRPVANVALLRGMAALPGTARELRAMREGFGEEQSRIFTREAATEAAVRSSDLSKARVIAFATHGLTPADLGSLGGAADVFELAEPGLVMTPPAEASEEDDGYLAASEVASLRLDADWVILSACNTATGDQADQGLSALARAFFYAGARNLLASHWPVHDDVAARMTVRTIELERSGLPRADAFQRAMREIRMDVSRDGPEGSWAHPFFWAPFVLIGDGGAGDP